MAAAGKQNLAWVILKWIGRMIAVIFQHARFQIWSLWAMGAVFVVVYGAQLTSILAGSWPIELASERLRYVGVGSWISLGIIAVSAVLVANVIRKANVSFGNAEFEVETTTTVTEAPKEEDDGTDDDPR